jgi:hypothetical protein
VKVEYTADQLTGFRTAFKERRSRGFVLSGLIVIVVLLALFLPPLERVWGTVWFLGIVGLVVVVVATHRCPACGKFLGRSMNHRFCPKCGIPLA